MNEERGFIEVITNEPTDHVAQSVYADWLAERSRPEEMAWRWIAAFRRRPCEFRLFRSSSEPYWEAVPINFNSPDHPHGGWGWIKWDYCLEWPWSAGMSTLPPPLYRWLPRGDEHAYGAVLYGGVSRAFAVLVDAYMQATAPRNWLQRRLYGPTWEPDWSLVLSVPDE